MLCQTQTLILFGILCFATVCLSFSIYPDETIQQSNGKTIYVGSIQGGSFLPNHTIKYWYIRTHPSSSF